MYMVAEILVRDNIRETVLEMLGDYPQAKG